MRLASLVFIAVTTLGVFSRSAVAELVRFDIAGTFDNISGIRPDPLELPTIGSPFFGSFVFDTNAPNSTAGSSVFGTYSTPFPNGVIALRVGQWEWKETSETPVSIVVGNNIERGALLADTYFVGDSRIELVTPGDPLPQPFEYTLFRWDLLGPPSIFTSTALPQEAFDLQPWSGKLWSISLWGTPPAPLLELTGTVTSFSSAVVPEPSSILYAVGSLWVLLLILWLRLR